MVKAAAASKKSSVSKKASSATAPAKAAAPAKSKSAAPAKSKKLSTKALSKAPKGKADATPAVVTKLLEANPFCSIILIEDEEAKKGEKPVLLIIKVCKSFRIVFLAFVILNIFGPISPLPQDYCEKDCDWSALDDGDVDIADAETAIERHMKSGCKLVKASDFKDLKVAREKADAEFDAKEGKAAAKPAAAKKAKAPKKSTAVAAPKKKSAVAKKK
jgi:hypothetical protein